MTFVSYAQNLEDVILRRALIHVERGFYIDVGAQDPVIDSVSFGFYQQDWRGVHVEPTARYAEAIRAARPDEKVIQAAVGMGSGSMSFFEFAHTGLSTGNKTIAERQVSTGRVSKRIDVPCVSLSAVLDDHQHKIIHWLKIDAEGMERDIIESWLPSRVRPWIVLVESVAPESHELTSLAWEPQLLALGYEFVYFDGLNRFYVSSEHPLLKASFGPGPNVFDDFVLSGTGSSSLHLTDTSAACRLHIVELSAANQALRGKIEELKRQIASKNHTVPSHPSGGMRFLKQAVRLVFRGRHERVTPVAHRLAVPEDHAASAISLSSESESTQRFYRRLVALRSSAPDRE
jgi:FkbM family methyltransferase